ncbi:winged helix-turn-helix transcriptional regulator [Nocardia testacea]|uniref:winged helix-turn-helix transcriptional regulator n=1 Tax=Nocardia testacea TaxID=248551 RepID=UPI003C2C5B8F
MPCRIARCRNRYGRQRSTRRLERNGMVDRIVTNTRPVAVEYRLTPLGGSLQDLIDVLLHWATGTLPEVERARARLDQEGETAVPVRATNELKYSRHSDAGGRRTARALPPNHGSPRRTATP